MKKILFAALLLLSLMVCVNSPLWAGGLEDGIAGFAAESRDNYDEAIRLYTKAIKSGELAGEQLKRVYKGRGYAWYGKGDYDRAIADYTKAIEIDPKDATTYYSRGCVWGQKGDYDKAIADYTKAIEIDPKVTGAYINRGNAWSYEGNYDKAIADYTKAIEIDPKVTRAYYGRGRAWGEKGDYDKSIVDLTKAIEINPKLSYAYDSRGYAWRKKGDYNKAIADYNKAIEIDQKDAYSYAGLAWLLAVCLESQFRNGVRAIELGKKAVDLRGTAGNIGTLAAAYAEAGRFQEAIKTQERAITKLKQEGGTQYLPEFEKHLSSYKAGKPWREK
jgi:tetratricopeptide (TPR) repeat protein